MKFHTKIFRSKIAHRIFFLFVSCALFPILCISIISFIRVTKQLNDQSYGLLKQSVTGYAYSVYERLIFLDTELQLIASSLKDSVHYANVIRPVVLDDELKRHFKAVAFFKPEKRYVPIYKVINDDKMPGKDMLLDIIHTGKIAIFWVQHPGSLPQIMMVGMTNKKDRNAGFLIGEINTDYLWGLNRGYSVLPAMDVCVLDKSKNIIFSSFSQQYPSKKHDDFQIKNSLSGQFAFVRENKKHLASYRKIYLDRQFLADEWTVVVSQSRAEALAPMSHFKTIFPPVVLMSLWVVMLLSIYTIRKSLVPLELLKEGTQRIAMRNFDSRVNVKSGDEFEELAMDFNEMADQLDRQFKTLNTMSEIDRAILSSLDTKIIVKNVIHRIYDWFVCDSVAICLMDSGQKNAGRMYFSFFSRRDKVFEESFEFIPSDLDVLQAHPEYLIVDKDKKRLSFLSLLVEQGVDTFLVLPVHLKEKLKAVIAIGRSRSKVINVEDITRVRRTADQVAVALSNATLVNDLDQLNWGTMKALARTVDAKSSWTAGHSTRVTDMALKVGAAMKLPPNKLDDLHRAALLHDIGKVGVPVSILDKPAALDDDEYAIIKKHPSIGVRILEPIAAYKEILPMVLQHHERYDGKGYPAGISGDEIDIGAKILAVADTVDAVRSDRPYRKGWDLERVIDLITKEAGYQFDPEVVEAFLEIMRPVNTTTASSAQRNMA
jgi:putative nucleotidyltransferase with HDIG domain